MVAETRRVTIPLLKKVRIPGVQSCQSCTTVTRMMSVGPPVPAMLLETL